MRVQIVPEKTTLSLHSPENLILIENADGGVIIRAAFDNLSEQGKASIVRYLVAEGFISDEFQGFPNSISQGSSSIIWVVDQSWVKREHALRKRADRFMVRLFVATSVLWVVLMSYALLHSAR